MAQLTINYKPVDKTYDVIVAGGGHGGRDGGLRGGA